MPLAARVSRREARKLRPDVMPRILVPKTVEASDDLKDFFHARVKPLDGRRRPCRADSGRLFSFLRGQHYLSRAIGIQHTNEKRN